MSRFRLAIGVLVAALAITGVSLRAQDAKAEKKIDVEVTDASVRDVIAEIAKASGRNIVVDKGVDAKITVQLRQIAWSEALDVVARLANLEVKDQGAVIVISRPGVAKPGPGNVPQGKAPFREYPIGDEVEREKEHMNVAAVWLPPVLMDHPCGPEAGPNVIHLECDVKATRGNLNGFAVGDWIPYMTIEYTLVAASGGKPLMQGKFMPMVAKDGPHYGATVQMPGTGKYKLTYKLLPPSTNGFGRHTDPVTGVAEWWAPYEVTFDWDYKGIPQDQK